MKTAVVTDSNSGILPEKGTGMGIYVVPMPVIIDEKIYYEGIDLTHEQFYKCLIDGRKILTSQPSPAEVTAVWDRALSEGYDQIVYIPMSDGLSNSCQTAQILAQDYEGKVCVVNNHRISVTQKQSVMDALNMAQQGYSAEKIKSVLEKSAYDSVIYVAVETMKYLKKGGRVTPSAATVGEILNIKPILIIKGEKLDAFAKAKGRKNAEKHLIEFMKKDIEKLKENGDEVHIASGGSFLTQEDSERWRQMVSDAFNDKNAFYDNLPLSIVCHIGPGAFGIGISRKIREEK